MVDLEVVRYSVSGVGVNLVFIGAVLIALALSTPRGARAHVTIPLAMLAYDALTVLNATGSLHAPTAGHARCLDFVAGGRAACVGALTTFAPVVAIDALAAALAASGVYPAAAAAPAAAPAPVVVSGRIVTKPHSH